MAGENCVFCNLSRDQVLMENDHALAIRDKFPARPLHTLVIPKRHITDMFRSTAEEREAIHALALAARQAILAEDPTVTGFNFGSNIGASAGQKVFHAHVHLIPRRDGEVELPTANPA
jgi:diadenosine tetraphosphate (Ap4A) HIT family hydrolase